MLPPAPGLAAALPLAEDLPESLDPWQVYRQLAGLPLAALLDSAMKHPELGRYSYVTADPFHSLTTRQYSRSAAMDWIPGGPENPFNVLGRELARYPTSVLPGLPPFQGGALGLFGYALCRALERLPPVPFDEFHTPDMMVGLYDWVIAFDHVQHRNWLISTGWPANHPKERHQRAAQRIHQVRRWLHDGVPARAADLGQSPARMAPSWKLPISGVVFSNFDRPTYLDTIARALEYIRAGDCFQVNIAQRLLCAARGSPLDLYDRLRNRNPAPFGAYLDLGDWIIASASPERFLRVEDGAVETRPIKGTCPHGRTPEEDLANQTKLRASAKDRAENVMIVDLLRNDLGRVCEYGSIQVPALCRLETYQYVHHLVSEVRGRLRPDRGPLRLLQAAFPGGSVTGAPKIRAMEIIAELEPTARGPYCGSIGYCGFNGNMDTSIVIRTFTIGRGWVQFPVGGGIVADSVPEREYDETLHKAEGMLRALQ